MNKRNESLNGCIIQFSTMLQESLYATTKLLICKVIRECNIHKTEYDKALYELTSKQDGVSIEEKTSNIFLAKELMTDEFIKETNNLSNQEIEISVQLIDWNEIAFKDNGERRELRFAYDFIELSPFFKNYPE